MNAPDATSRFFTVDEANRALPYVRSVVNDIVELFREVHARRDRLAKIRQRRQPQSDESPYEQELQLAEAELEKDIEELDGFVGELKAMGVELKDPAKGTVGFPAVADDGHEIRLSWTLGETEVGHWHEVGSADRQSLLAGAGCGEPAGDLPAADAFDA